MGERPTFVDPSNLSRGGRRDLRRHFAIVGDLPTGMSVDGSLISGTATTPGVFEYTFTYCLGPVCALEIPYRTTVVAAPPETPGRPGDRPGRTAGRHPITQRPPATPADRPGWPPGGAQLPAGVGVGGGRRPTTRTGAATARQPAGDTHRCRRPVGAPTTRTGGPTARQPSPVTIRSTAATAPSTSLLPCTYRPHGRPLGGVEARVVDRVEEVLERPAHRPEVGRACPARSRRPRARRPPRR